MKHLVLATVLVGLVSPLLAQAPSAPPQPASPRLSMELATVSLQPTAVMRFKVPPAEIGTKLGEVLPAVLSHVEAANLPAGHFFSRYFGISDGLMEMEAGVMVPEAITGSGEIVAGTLPGGRAATTLFIGHYQGLAAAHNELAAWARQQNRAAVAGGVWEVYLTNPGNEPDPARWRTQLYLAVTE